MQGVPTTTTTIFRFEHDLIAHLAFRGSWAAVDVLRQLLAEAPNDVSLARALAGAIAAARAGDWIPLAPAELLAMVRDHGKRIVNTIDDLMRTVLESLQRMQDELRGPTPGASLLWNRWTANRKSRWRPKDERELANLICLHLRRDIAQRGIVINREVEISARERTDIHIDAAAPNRGPSSGLKVIVEAKGCWNSDLRTAMRRQLRDRYLRNNPGAGGIYLVGWYDRERWDPSDSRRARAPSWSVEEARSFFDDQAARLASSTIPIEAVVLDLALR